MYGMKDNQGTKPNNYNNKQAVGIKSYEINLVIMKKTVMNQYGHASPKNFQNMSPLPMDRSLNSTTPQLLLNSSANGNFEQANYQS